MEEGYQKAADLKDLEEGKSIEVEVGPLPVLLHRRDGKIYATGAYCPHQDVRVFPENCSERFILCTAHGYRTDLRTGVCRTDESLSMPTYSTLVENGEIWVKLF